MLTFLSFSAIASSIYVLNDILDAPKDRLHPRKKSRPIAARKINASFAFLIFYFLILIAFSLGCLVGPNILIVLLLYFAINLFYSFGLKNISIFDVMIVAIGFVFRVVVGALAINVEISHWMLLCTFFISLFVAFGKRKNEMNLMKKDDLMVHRKSAGNYSDNFISQALTISAGISIVFYSLYTIDYKTTERFGSDNLIYTTPLVVFGILRYLHLLYNKNDGGDPVSIFSKDLSIIVCFILWVVSIILIYLYPSVYLL